MVRFYHLYYQSYWEQEKDDKQSTFLSAAWRSTVCASNKDAISPVVTLLELRTDCTFSCGSIKVSKFVAFKSNYKSYFVIQKT